MIQFGQPLALYGFAAALILLPALAWWNDRRSRRLLQKFAADSMIGRLSASFSRGRARCKAALSVLACLLLILALARPQWGTVTEEIEIRGVDILFALDTSRSMLAEDYPPNRLERSKLAIIDLVSQLKGDRVGLIAFAGNAFLQTPLTLDYPAFLQTLQEIDTNTIPQGGTDVAGAIEEAMAYFGESENHRVLILISDGEDLAASGIERADEAAATGLSIFTVGVGSVEGELIPLHGPGGQIDYVRRPNGDPVRTRLDEESLRAIADAGNGLYQRLGHGLGGLHEVYEAARASIDEQNLGLLTRETPIERYHWPLLLALICLVLEWAIGTRKRQSSLPHKPLRKKQNPRNPTPPASHEASHTTRTNFVARFVRSGTPRPAAHQKAPASHEASHTSSDELPLGFFRSQLRKKRNNRVDIDSSNQIPVFTKRPTLSRFAFFLLPFTFFLFSPPSANASPRQAENAYRSGNYERAITLWGEAANANPQDATLHYNLGNAHYRAGDFAAAIDAYQQALPLADVVLQERIFHNLGNAQYQLGAQKIAEDPNRASELWKDALRSYANCLALNPEAADASRSQSWVEEQFALKGARIEVVASPPAGGTTSSGGLLLQGVQLQLTAEPNHGWRFAGWKGADVEDPEAAETILVVEEDVKVVANFVETRQLIVTTADPAQGSAGTSGQFDLDQEVPIEAEAEDYFAFDRWVSDTLEVADPTAAKTTVKLSDNGTVTATFTEAFRLDITVEPAIGGTAGESGFYTTHSEVPIQAKARDGFRWLGWSGPVIAGIADIHAPQTHITLNADRQIVAQFERVWDLVVLPNTDQGGTATGGGNFEPGTLQPIEAKPNQGFTFVRWEGVGVTDPDAASTTVEIQPGIQDVVAIFEKADEQGEKDSNSGGENNEQQQSPESQSNPEDSEKDSSQENPSSDGADSSKQEENPSNEPTDSPDSKPDDANADGETSEEQRAGEKNSAAAANPLKLTEEEAQQLLQILRQNARQLPLRPKQPAEREPSDGRNW